MADQLVVGVDFGTLSGRAVVVRVRDGAELGSAVYDYPHGVREDRPGWALQVPYLGVLKYAVPEALQGLDTNDVIGIGTDFTACTVMPTTADGTPLCELAEFENEPYAYVKLWKHHAAQPQADRINRIAEERAEPWLARYGGLISSEWEFAKALQVLEEAPEVYREMRYWVELADWIVWRLTGTYARNIATAGYKGMYQDGYPSRDYLKALNPAFADFTAKLDAPLKPLGAKAGGLTREAAAWTGLPEGIAVAVGNIDAHVTVPAAGASQPGRMVAIMGTSTCHMMSGTELREVPGMCGVVDGGIVAGQWGYEAGQSGVGDIFAWYVENCVPPRYHENGDVHATLTELAAEQEVGEHGLVALDWHSGNRSVLVDHALSGVIVGQTLATRAEHGYRALLEATAFGTRTIIETFRAAGVPVDDLVVAGGLVKNPLLMQIYADVLDMPLSVIGSEQGAALGAAIHGAVAAGAYPDVHAASATMGSTRRDVYRPINANVQAYQRLYAEYLTLHDYFGRGGNDVMKRLARRS
ncbi:ribulokinase [Lentzea sp. NBRC 105346]|uniref:ribulokinase n=1 Tax=Lentzea sp. NBRC 105346 TaxID=3032205 RepID=UPI0024A4F119|nr:ribulokinase [Lentzea sp. NBRC 105346]GLZ33785.1 ribulokinase [Lentzea sp. NBRC 105346]